MSTHAEQVDADKPPAIAWLAWVWVMVPFLVGLSQLLIKIPALFSA